MDQNNHNTRLGRNLALLRARSALSLDVLANYLDISSEELCLYETGNQVMPSTLVCKAAVLFGVKEYDFYSKNAIAHLESPVMAFCGERMTAADLESVAAFNKIVRNHLDIQAVITQKREGIDL